MGVPPPLSHLRCSMGLWAAPNLLPSSALSAPVPALTELSLEEELNRVCGGMLVMPDLLFGVSFSGAPVLGGRRAPANWVLTVASLRGCSCWGVVPSML